MLALCFILPGGAPKIISRPASIRFSNQIQTIYEWANRNRVPPIHQIDVACYCKSDVYVTKAREPA